MSSTPEISCKAVVKLSPFGCGISKSLLTPCRRIGLSRKRKTSSVLNRSEKKGNLSDISFTESPVIAPLSNDNSNADTPKCPKADSFNINSADENTSNRDTRGDVSNRNKVCRKKLEQSFYHGSTSLAEVTGTNINRVKGSDFNDNQKDAHIITVKALVHNSDIENCEDKLCYGERADFDTAKSKKKVKSDSYKSYMKESNDCAVVLNKITTEDLHKRSENIELEESEEFFLVKRKRKKIAMIDDDDDDDYFTSNPKISNYSKEKDLNTNKQNINHLKNTVLRKVLSDKQKSDMVAEKLLVIEKKKSEPITSLEKKKAEKSIHKNIVDEDDAFTSTPDQEKNEKKDLIENIKSLEAKVKEKRKRVQDLKQALVYKKKHNIDELRELRELWRQGCVQGLHGLLTQLQSHTPMDMLALLNKLNISSDTAKTLSLEIY